MRIFSLLPRIMVLGGHKSKIFKKRGVTSDTTDYGIVTGTKVITGHKGFKNIRIGSYWIDGFQSEHYDDRDWWVSYTDVLMETIRINGWKYENVSSEECGIRLAMMYTSENDLEKNKDSVVKRISDGLVEIEYGYYPQTVVDDEMQSVLEKMYFSRRLKMTGNKYSTYTEKGNRTEKSLNENYEFEYNGKRYVRFDLDKNNFNFYSDYVRNSEGSLRKCLWFEVKPVKWLLDEEYKLMVTDKIILGGVPYNCNKKIEENAAGYKNTIVRRFINNYMEKELLMCERERVKKEELEENVLYKNKIKKNDKDDFER